MTASKSIFGPALLFVALALATSGCAHMPSPDAFPQSYAPTTYYVGEPSQVPLGATGFLDGNHVTVLVPPAVGQSAATAATQADGAASAATADAPFTEPAVPALTAPAVEAPALEDAGTIIGDGLFWEEAGEIVGGVLLF